KTPLYIKTQAGGVDCVRSEASNVDGSLSEVSWS
ncbi:hypothetical protein scyTo_0015240, partial [Scyliorhinus torazame]|nr:hypothetical protein [Scyliorhinus torazame]